MDSVSPDGKALIRLEIQVENLTSAVKNLESLIQGGNGPAEQKLAKHEQHVNDRLGKIESTLEKMNAKLEERGKFPFALVFSFTTLLLGIGGIVGNIFLTGVNQNMARIDRDISSIQQQIVPRVEHIDRWRSIERAAAENSRRIEVIEQSQRAASR